MCLSRIEMLHIFTVHLRIVPTINSRNICHQVNETKSGGIAVPLMGSYLAQSWALCVQYIGRSGGSFWGLM